MRESEDMLRELERIQIDVAYAARNAALLRRDIGAELAVEVENSLDEALDAIDEALTKLRGIV